MRQSEPRNDTPIPAATHALNIQQVGYGICYRVKMDIIELIFIDHGVKVNGQYYRDVLLSQQMLPAIKRVATRQRSGTSRPQHHPAAAAGDTRLHRSWPLAAKQSRSEPRQLQDLGSRAAACI